MVARQRGALLCFIVAWTAVAQPMPLSGIRQVVLGITLAATMLAFIAPSEEEVKGH